MRFMVGDRVREKAGGPWGTVTDRSTFDETSEMSGVSYISVTWDNGAYDRGWYDWPQKKVKRDYRTTLQLEKAKVDYQDYADYYTSITEIER